VCKSSGKTTSDDNIGKSDEEGVLFSRWTNESDDKDIMKNGRSATVEEEPLKRKICKALMDSKNGKGL
jgi:hypothetical protein